MLCCVCLQETSNNIGIFEDIGLQLKIADIINKYLWFNPHPDNSLTTQICKICWKKIDNFHIFYQIIEKAHKEYERITASCIKTEAQCTASPIKLEQESIEEEILNNKDLGVEMTNDIFKNPLEECDANDVSFHDESGDDDDEECSSSDDYAPSILTEQESSLEEESQITQLDKDQEEKHIQDKVRHKRPKNIDKGNATKKKRTVQRLDPIHTEEMIRKHIPMGCNLCLFVGTTFSDIVQHFKSVHPNIRPYIMCCDKKLSKRFFVAQHALNHEDPNCFSCTECQKSFKSISGLRTHNLTYHASNEDLIYACDSCPKKFAIRNLLELHKTSHIPKEEWQHVCNICPEKKVFASAYLLTVHTSLRHKREAHICPVCAKKIIDKKSYEKHVRLHYEDSGPRVKCPYPDCESWLKDEDNLKQHLRRHNPKGIVCKCDECGKECKNARAVRNHKRYAHSNETFQCEQCDKIFKRAISLREHMTQHTGETLYKCPFCTRTFNSNANMHSHKKKQHPIEWDNWRKNKRGSAQKLINDKNPLNQFDETDLGENLILM